MASREQELPELKKSLKELIIKELSLEDIAPEDIKDDEVLFGEEGLGLDSLDAVEIVVLLQRNFGWQEFLYEISPVLVEEEAFENVNCYRIQGAGRGERRYELWIGKSDYLVRKIITTYSNFSSEEIHRGIEVNQPVCAGMLTFIAPMSADAPGTTGNHTGLRN